MYNASIKGATVSLLALLALMVGAVGCGDELTQDQLDILGQARVNFFANAPGTRLDNERNRMPAELLVETIDRAQNSLDACVYGFSNQKIIDAVVRAHYRGVKVRVVGDAKHFGYGERGYRTMQQHRIPIQVGNQFHIMHNKYFLVDDRIVFVGTGNITTTGFAKNNNNWLFIDHKGVGMDFKAEFNQMFSGRFSTAKQRNYNGNTYQVGDTEITVLFSPHEDTMGRVLEELDAATDSVHFQIFAFTKDQVGSRFIRKHREWAEYSKQNNQWELPAIKRDKKVVGILDKSQLHGNGQYHEGYRLLMHGVPMRIDANANSFLPGDYQAGGGRLHTKTMVLDEATDNARVVTGSFNWSSAATIANDEVLLVLKGKRITQQYMEVWNDIYNESVGLPMGLCSANLNAEEYVCAQGDREGKTVKPGDILISEVHWDGWNGLTDTTDRTGTRDDLSNDEFIELYNTTDNPIDLSMWTIGNGYDFILGFTPGTVIQPKSHFLVVDHNSTPYSDTQPQRGSEGFQNPDFVLNQANDPRFPRLNLRNSSLRVELRAPQDTTQAGSTRESLLIDVVGNYGPPFAGGRVGQRVYSMERLRVGDSYAADGTDPSSWQSCKLPAGGENVTPEFRDTIIASPGQPNSQ